MWMTMWLLACRPPEPDVRLVPSPATTAADLEVRPAPGIGEQFDYRWSVDGDVQLGLVDDVVPARRLQRGQQWEVEVTRRWGARRSAPTMLSTTIENGAPTATVTILSSDAGLLAVAGGDDPDGDPITTRVQWTVDGVVESQLPGVAPRRLEVGQEWTVTAWASDGTAEGPPATASIVIDTTFPDLSSAAITPDPPRAVDELELTLLPPPEDHQQVEAEWYAGDQFVHFGPTLPSLVVGRGDVVSAQVWVRDGDHLAGPVTAPGVRVENTAPRLGGVTLTPPVLSEGTIASCDAEGFEDPDGDPEEVEVHWFVDFAFVARGPVLTGADFDRGQQVRCEAIPVDPESQGQSVFSEIAEVVNTPPTFSEVRLEPADPVTGDVVTAVAEGLFDPDGDDVVVELTWFVDGDEVATGPWLPTTVSQGQVIEVVGQPFDGIERGVEVSSLITEVGNAGPEVTDIRYLPDPPEASAALTVEVDLFDIEGDKPITPRTRWYVDGKLVSEDDSLAAGTLTVGQEVVAEVQAEDPFGFGPVATGEPVVVVE